MVFVTRRTRACQWCHASILGSGTRYCSRQCASNARWATDSERARREAHAVVLPGRDWMVPAVGSTDWLVSQKIEEGLKYWRQHVGDIALYREPCGGTEEAGRVKRVWDKSVWVDYGRGPERTNPLNLSLVAS